MADMPIDLNPANAVQNARKNVDEMRLVSKQYHAETMQHLVEYNTFRLPRLGNTLGQVSEKFACNIRSLVLDWRGYQMMEQLDLNRLCPKLKSLELSFDFGLLHKMFSNFSAVPASDELRKSSIVTSLSLVRGLSHFEIRKIHEYHMAIFAPSLTEHWDLDSALKNIAEKIELLEEVLRTIVTAKKVESTPRFPRAAKKSRQY
jgi:hypothetical protein